MSKRVLGLIIVVLFAVMAAGTLYAEQAKGKMGEVDRCTMTCSMLIDHYNKQFAAMKAHEGDKQCWETCSSRMGRSETGSAAEMKSLWMDKMGSTMRVNQCAQACWRKHNDNSNTVAVGGWRSEPRSTVCAP